MYEFKKSEIKTSLLIKNNFFLFKQKNTYLNQKININFYYLFYNYFKFKNDKIDLIVFKFNFKNYKKTQFDFLNFYNFMINLVPNTDLFSNKYNMYKYLYNIKI